MSEPTLWILDRIEDGKTAVLVSTSGEERTVPRTSLPSEAREGDALRESGGGTEEKGDAATGTAGSESVDRPTDLRFRVDHDATERLRNEARDLRSSLRRGPSGPISL